MTQTSRAETIDLHAADAPGARGPEDAEQCASGRWPRRPVFSALLRFVIVLTPFVLACVVGRMAGYAIGGNGIGAAALRIVVAGVVSIWTFAVVERLARRFLPLATL